MLGDGILELAVDFHLHESFIVISGMVQFKDAAIVLAAEVTLPQASRRRHELVLHIHVPVLVLAVEFEVLALSHVVDGEDSIVLLLRVVLEGHDRVGDHLFKVMHFMHVLSLVPDAVWLVNEDKVLVFRVNHSADVIPVRVLQQDEHLHAVGCVSRAHNCTLGTILDVHIFVIITVSVALEAPATSILELLWDLPPVPIIRHPVEGGCSIGRVDLKEVEAGSEAKSAHRHGFPEAHPLNYTTVLIDSLSLLEVERGVGAHRRRLNEWLELVTGMRWCSLNAEDAFDGLLAEDGVAKTRGDVRELLVITPLDFPLVTLVVIVMARRWPRLKSLLVVDLLGLREPGAGRLSPSVVELEVNVVQMGVDVFTVGGLVVLGWDETLLLQVLRADLRNVHVDEVGVVPVDLHHLVGVLAVDVDVVVGADVLVGQDRLWLAELVAWGIHVGNLQVASLLLLINLEEEVLLGDHLIVGILSELLSADLVFEFDEADLLLHNFVDPLANLSEVLRASRFTQWLVGAWNA